MAKIDSRKRAERIFEQIGDAADTFVLANGTEPHIDASFFYVTGYTYGLFEGSYLVVEKNGNLSLVTSLVEEPIARAFGNDIEIFAVGDRDQMVSKLGSIARKSFKKPIALNSAELTYSSFLQIKSNFKGSKLLDKSEAFESARMIKDESEIALIQRACDIASGIY